jgi:hypothetical protein
MRIAPAPVVKATAAAAAQRPSGRAASFVSPGRSRPDRPPEGSAPTSKPIHSFSSLNIFCIVLTIQHCSSKNLALMKAVGRPLQKHHN